MANKKGNTAGDGYKYLRTGDETGDMCYDCGSFLKIDKTGSGSWSLYCSCGRVLPFISNAYNDSAFK